MNVVAAEALRSIVSTTATARNTTMKLLGDLARIALLSENEALPDISLQPELDFDEPELDEEQVDSSPNDVAQLTRARQLAAQRARTWRAKKRTCPEMTSRNVTHADRNVTRNVTAVTSVAPPGSPLSENLPGISSISKIPGDLGSETRASESVTERDGRHVTERDASRVTERDGQRDARPPPVVQLPLQSSSLRNITADGAGGLAVTAWCDGIRSVNLGAVVLTPRGTELAKLCEALVAVEPDPGKRTQKAFADGAAFARARKGEKISAHGYVDWLQGDRSERGSGIRKVLLQPASPHWKVGLPSGAR
jgi:hypothetical protein